MIPRGPANSLKRGLTPSGLAHLEDGLLPWAAGVMYSAHILFLKIGLMFKNLEISLKTQTYDLPFKI